MKIKFSPTAKVIIEPGSTVTLSNGAILTSNFQPDPCATPYTWKGVEVQGNKALSQNAVPLVQGKLVLNANSKIEYAENGAYTYAYSANNVILINTTGGIIIANAGSSFVNNRVDVDFKPYQNFSGSTMLGNVSRFTGVNFVNDNKYPFSGAPEHVKIDGCYGFVFNNCNFTNDISQPMFNKLSMGIKGLDAGFTVNNNSQFNNLYHAIDVKKVSVNRAYAVSGSNFTNNQIGIYTSGVNNFSIQQNTFAIGNNLRAGATTQMGISNSAGSGFTIRDNIFNLPLVYISAVNKWGIVMSETGQAANQVYNNTFNNISIGNYATGINRSSSNGNLQGLQYLCNTNNNNIKYDFYITSTENAAYEGIRLFQGTSSSAARNLFSTNTNTLNGNDINNQTSGLLTYNYKTPPTSANPTSLINVITQSVASATNVCPVSLPDLDRLLTNSEIEQITTDFSTAENSYLNLLYNYNQLMDGGNTNVLLMQMQQTWSTEATAFRDEMLAMSPYLSEEALREAAGIDILPDAMMLMVCLSNPDATRSEDFLKYLQYECPNPLPQYIIDLIIASWEDGTPRTTMENLLAGYNEGMAVNADKILTDLYLKMQRDTIDETDTTNYIQQINYWLNRIQTTTAKYDLIESYKLTDENELAEQVLQSIPVDFSLTEHEQIAYDDFIAFSEIRQSVIANGNDLSSLDNSQIETIVLLVESGAQNYARTLAQNVLCFYYDICYEPIYDEGSGGRFTNSGNAPYAVNTNSFGSLTNHISVSPNPAKETATFNYELNNVTGQPELVVNDITGKTIAQFILQDLNGSILWNTASVKAGLYYYYVKDGKGRLAKGKMTVGK